MPEHTTETALYIADLADLLPYDAERNGQSSPLSWGKFRTPATPAAKVGNGPKTRHELYSMRRAAIKSRPRGWAILAVYDEILIYFGFARRAALRGWLSNHLYKPATPKQIASVISCNDLPLMRLAMKALEEEGLLIRVPLIDLAEADRKDMTTYPQCPPPPRITDDSNDSPADDAPQGEEARAEDEVNKAEADNPPTAGRTGCNRNRSGTQPGDVTRETPDGQTADGQTPSAASAAPPPLPADGHGKTAEKRQPASQPDGQTADKPQETATPSQAGPDVPQATDGHTAEPEAAGDQQATAPPQPTAVPPQPTEADPGQAGTASETTRRPGHDGMSWHAETFAQQILAALYPTREDLVLQGRRAKGGPQGPDEFEARELGCFRDAFDQALVEMDQVEAMRLLTRSLKEAQRAHKVKCKSTRGRYWRWWFGQHMAAIRRERAGGSGPP